MAGRRAEDPTHLDDHLDAVLIGGRETVTIEIAEYDPGWPGRYEAERSRIAAALGEHALRIEHIGSTAVPGLAAKPIIDIFVGVRDADDEDAYRAPLEALGLTLRVREPGHRMFRTPARDVHVHVWPAAGETIDHYLALRDRLRSHTADRELYARTKRELAARAWPDMNYYADAKGRVIEAIMERARADR